jgi:flagellar biosynthesis/type III secretory pathway protein FliH
MMTVSEQPYSNGYDDGFEDGKIEGHREGFDAGQQHHMQVAAFVTAGFADKIEHWKSLLREAIGELRELDFNNEKAHHLMEWIEDDDNQLIEPIKMTRDDVRFWWVKPK